MFTYMIRYRILQVVIELSYREGILLLLEVVVDR